MTGDVPPPREAAFDSAIARHSTSHEDLNAAIRAYNPTLNDTLQQQMKRRFAVSDTLRLAGQLVRYLRDAAAAAHHTDEPSTETAHAMDLLQRGIDVCRVRYTTSASPAATPSLTRDALWASTAAARESAGIGIRFHNAVASVGPQGQRRRRPVPRCFLLSHTDVQVSEVLPSGAVVVFTHPTAPAEMAERALSTSLHGFEADEEMDSAVPPTPHKKRGGRAPLSFSRSVEMCLKTSPAEVHLHCVLYRCNVSMAAAVADLVAAAEGHVTPDDIRVRSDMRESDEHVVVQLCSVRVVIPPALRDESCADEALQHCLHVARSLVCVNGADDVAARDATVGLQLLGCRLHACTTPWSRSLERSETAAEEHVQYALLLRGFEHRGGPLDQVERAALACGAAIPNFFSPHHFGSPGVVFFRTYHVTAALERGQYAEAAAMVLCLECGAAPRGRPLVPWLQHALHLLCSGEEREGVWQVWWLQHVPTTEQTRLLRAKSEVVWNVLASCRLLELAAAAKGRRDALLAACPEAGDFVRSSSREADEDSGKDDVKSTTASPALPLYTHAEATRYSIQDIVIPVLHRGGAAEVGCESVAEVERRLGFATPRRRRRSIGAALDPPHSSQPHGSVFRPLFTSATGFPRAARAWVRSFDEPTNVAASAGRPGVFSLATDWELASGDGGERDYAAKSRGPRAQVWPLSKRGRALADRLPVGLLAVASASGSSLQETETSPSRRHASRSLAIHCTLPANVSLSNYLCEFTTVEDLRQSAQKR